MHSIICVILSNTCICCIFVSDPVLQNIILDNEIDGEAFLMLTDNDLHTMFPNKVGIVRKLMNLSQVI